MSYNNYLLMKLVKDTVKNQENEKNVSDKEAEEAFKTILNGLGKIQKERV